MEAPSFPDVDMGEAAMQPRSGVGYSAALIGLVMIFIFSMEDFVVVTPSRFCTILSRERVTAADDVWAQTRTHSRPTKAQEALITTGRHVQKAQDSSPSNPPEPEVFCVAPVRKWRAAESWKPSRSYDEKLRRWWAPIISDEEDGAWVEYGDEQRSAIAQAALDQAQHREDIIRDAKALAAVDQHPDGPSRPLSQGATPSPIETEFPRAQVDCSAAIPSAIDVMEPVHPKDYLLSGFDFTQRKRRGGQKVELFSPEHHSRDSFLVTTPSGNVEPSQPHPPHSRTPSMLPPLSRHASSFKPFSDHVPNGQQHHSRGPSTLPPLAVRGTSLSRRQTVDPSASDENVAELFQNLLAASSNVARRMW
jgi:hypothetical protein